MYVLSSCNVHRLRGFYMAHTSMHASLSHANVAAQARGTAQILCYVTIYSQSTNEMRMLKHGRGFQQNTAASSGPQPFGNAECKADPYAAAGSGSSPARKALIVDQTIGEARFACRGDSCGGLCISFVGDVVGVLWAPVRRIRTRVRREEELLAPNAPLTLTITASPTSSPFTGSLTCFHHLWPAAGCLGRRPGDWVKPDVIGPLFSSYPIYVSNAVHGDISHVLTPNCRPTSTPSHRGRPDDAVAWRHRGRPRVRRPNLAESLPITRDAAAAWNARTDPTCEPKSSEPTSTTFA